MLLSQGYQTQDSKLLYYPYCEDVVEYETAEYSWNLPEGAEQIQATVQGLYLLFESACWPYRDTVRIPNDQIYLVRIPEAYTQK